MGGMSIKEDNGREVTQVRVKQLDQLEKWTGELVPKKAGGVVLQAGVSTSTWCYCACVGAVLQAGESISTWCYVAC